MESSGYRLTVGDSVLNISGNETILQCASQHCITLKYCCAAGYCGRCKVRLISGVVHLDHSGGISREEIASGFILSCCSFPRSDVVIESGG